MCGSSGRWRRFSLPDVATHADVDAASPAAAVWRQACLAAALFAIDPAGTGGVLLRAAPGPARTRWRALLASLLPEDARLRRVPAGVSDDRLIGGLDLPATLRKGRPVIDRGLLAEANGGVVVLAMAERLSPSLAARITAALDSGEIVVEREGIAAREMTRFGVVAEDEGIADEAPPSGLLDRLAFHLDLSHLSIRDLPDPPIVRRDVLAARAALPAVEMPESALRALCATALAMGIDSLRPPLLAARVARTAAALEGRASVEEGDLVAAATLVLAPRATQIPQSAEEESPPMEEERPPDEPEAGEPNEEPEAEQGPLEDRVLEATAAAIPKALLDRLAPSRRLSRQASTAGKSGLAKRSLRRGRPIGSRPGRPHAGVRLNVIDTLRAAAPWQRLREQTAAAAEASQRRRLRVLADDFRVTRFKQQSETVTIFVVDASGSAAFHRLAEAKGAVELLLADCYVRRDQVALIAFRGSEAELLLPPTRSLLRAKRSLAGLPGGGGTPLSAGIEVATTLALNQQSRGVSPLLVFLTDGQANIARDGQPGRAQARADSEAAAERLAREELSALFVDTAPRPSEAARSLAARMDAHYLALPRADAHRLNAAVRNSRGA